MAEQLKIKLIKSVDTRKLWIPKLFLYKNGISVNPGTELKVTETEFKHLLKQRNGKRPSFIEVQPVRRKSSESEE